MKEIKISDAVFEILSKLSQKHGFDTKKECLEFLIRVHEKELY